MSGSIYLEFSSGGPRGDSDFSFIMGSRCASAYLKAYACVCLIFSELPFRSTTLGRALNSAPALGPPDNHFVMGSLFNRRRSFPLASYSVSVRLPLSATGGGRLRSGVTPLKRPSGFQGLFPLRNGFMLRVSFLFAFTLAFISCSVSLRLTFSAAGGVRQPLSPSHSGPPASILAAQISEYSIFLILHERFKLYE